MHIAFVTAGGAGMFCGSCMQDNSLARALLKLDCDVSLIPTYTPIRLDQEDVTDKQVYLGGINLYLDSYLPFWRKLPRSLVSWLDNPRIISLATRFGIENDGAKLGPMTLAMLNGAEGPMRREYQELVDHLVDDLNPDIIIFSNVLLSGVIPQLRERCDKPILALIQGDDLFLNQLPEKYRADAIAAIRRNTKSVAGFVTHTRYYAKLMSAYLGLDEQRFYQIPLSVDLQEELLRRALQTRSSRNSSTPRIGYFARIAPEKGLKQLIEAACHLKASGVDFELHTGGYLGPGHRRYFREIEQLARPLGERFQYIGSPETEAEKIDFYQNLDLFSVPTVYEEPKGLYLLEAMSLGIPVVQPQRGSFPELIESTGGGLLFEADNSLAHAEMMQRLLENSEQREELSRTALERVAARHTSRQAAASLLDICKRVIEVNS